METDEFKIVLEKKEHIQGVIKLIRDNSLHTREIMEDFGSEVKYCVKYHLVDEFHKAHEDSTTSRNDISRELMEIASCWCCGKKLSECLTLEEEGYTWIHSEADPYIMDRAREQGMTYIDESGHERMYSCGYSYS